MALEAKKQERENSQTLVRRFAQRVRKSGILRLARKIRFRGRPKSRQMMKKAALRREKLRQEHERLKKIGRGKI